MDSLVLWSLVALLLTGVLCARVGLWLVVQREGMTADGISHGVLPGLVLAFVVTGTRNPIPMVIGGAISGVLTVTLTRYLDRLRGIPGDAALGASFSIFFALGALLVTRFAGQVDLDPGCVLYGLAEMIPLETVALGGARIPTAVVTLVPTLLATWAITWLLYKELLMASFDPDFGQINRFRPHLLRLIHTILVAIVCVVSFEVVGSILVVALIVAPAATARLIRNDMRSLGVVSLVLATTGILLGYGLATALNTSVAGSIALTMGLQFAVVLAVREWRVRAGQRATATQIREA
ncbi:MAG: metal ABC transporter permease [Chthonomonas sp.]|nr:metal ABC transporter permease [Chthonomonas sp.]